MKTICEFLRKGVFFSHSRCLPIEGTFYCRTNLAFSIRYISEKYLQDVKIATSRQNGTKRNRKCYGSKWPIPKRKNDGQMPLYPCGQNVHVEAGAFWPICFYLLVWVILTHTTLYFALCHLGARLWAWCTASISHLYTVSKTPNLSCNKMSPQ